MKRDELLALRGSLITRLPPEETRLMLGLLEAKYPATTEKLRRDQNILAFVTKRLSDGYSLRYCVDQAATLFEVSPDTVRRVAKSGGVFALTSAGESRHTPDQED